MGRLLSKGLPFLTIALFSLSLIGCANADVEEVDALQVEYVELEDVEIDDKYRTYYQIFPISFSDGDGDGRGDLQGIIDKIPYIKEMGYTGVWLNPIHPSATYHHYDVEDYMAIDPSFGTLETFDKLVEGLHKEGINIILDLVINHSSNSHEWFQESYIMASANQKTSEEYLRYNWIDCTGSAPTGYHKVNSSDSIAYESRFDAMMPDLNLQQVLDNPTSGDLATKLKEIFSFWLVDHDVDGFRLDAVTSYFTNDNAKNTEFLTWVNTECKKLKEDCYIVGEGDWGSNSAINKGFQSSGVDSFFEFANSAKNNGHPIRAVTQQRANRYITALTDNEDTADGGIEAPMLGNHDLPRYVGSVSGRSESSNAKLALGFLQMLKGTTFTYYGDELGMASQNTTADGYFRLPVKWGEGDSHSCDVSKLKISNISVSALDDSMSYPHGDVLTQQNDPDSILNYAKKANGLRKKIPALARGSFEESYVSSDRAFAIVKRVYQDDTIYVALNCSKANPATYDFKDYGTPIAELCPSGHVSYLEEGSTSLVIPAQSILILAQ